MKQTEEKQIPPCPTAEAMRKRYGNTVTSMRHKTDRRSKAKKNSWRNEEW